MHIDLSIRRLLGGATLVTGLLVTTACASRTHVELDAAQAPEVRPAAGADGQNDAAVFEAGVVEAGVVEIDDLPLPITTPAPATTPTDAPTTSRPDDQQAGDQTSEDQTSEDQTGNDRAAAMIAELCAGDLRTLRVAVEAYRDEFDTSPTSELELVASGYIYELSNVYDVRVDGSVVPSDTTCAD